MEQADATASKGRLAMDDLFIWPACCLLLSIAFVVFHRKFIGDSLEDAMLLGIVFTMIALSGPLTLIVFCIAYAAGIAQRLIP